jgi:DNA-binding response OmpR family regulator
MLKILLATPSRERLAELAAALSSQEGVSVSWAGSGREALESIGKVPPHLVVIDQALEDTAPFALVAQVMAANAMVNTAVVSGLSSDEFHQAGEGLGIMAQLPVPPGREHASQILARLKNLTGP